MTSYQNAGWSQQQLDEMRFGQNYETERLVSSRSPIVRPVGAMVSRNPSQVTTTHQIRTEQAPPSEVRMVTQGTSETGKWYRVDDERQRHYSGYSQQNLIDSHQHQTILSERVIEHEIKVPKRIVREEVVEKTIIVPERVITEEIIEEIKKVREKIIEVAKPVIKETYVEVPEIKYIEKIVEVPEKVFRENTKRVPVIEYRERIVEVPKVIKQDRFVEVPEIEYREAPYEKIVEVPEVREQIVIKEVKVPQYVDKVVPEYYSVQVPQDVIRHVPIPIVASTNFTYQKRQLKPKYETRELNVYVPRFIEVPVPAEIMTPEAAIQAQIYIEQVANLTAQQAASLCEIENVAGTIKNSDIANVMEKADYTSALKEAWKHGQMKIEVSKDREDTTTTTDSRQLPPRHSSHRQSSHRQSPRRHSTSLKHESASAESPKYHRRHRDEKTRKRYNERRRESSIEEPRHSSGRRR